MARRVFRPRLWATLVTPVAVAAFLALGTWQLRRGDDKAQLRAAFATAALPSATLSSATPPGPAPRRVAAAGHYIPDRTLFHDGQSHARSPGRHVWTPMRLEDGTVVLVNRGWVGPDAPVPAPPATPARIEGYWRTLPEPGLRLAAANPCPPRPAFPATVLYPSHAQLECMLGERVLPGLLLLDAAAPGGFVRDWHHVGVPPARHYAYALNWFAFALLVATLYFVLNLRRIP